jgi:hypothetical protein
MAEWVRGKSIEGGTRPVLPQKLDFLSPTSDQGVQICDGRNSRQSVVKIVLQIVDHKRGSEHRQGRLDYRQICFPGHCRRFEKQTVDSPERSAAFAQGLRRSWTRYQRTKIEGEFRGIALEKALDIGIAKIDNGLRIKLNGYDRCRRGGPTECLNLLHAGKMIFREVKYPCSTGDVKSLCVDRPPFTERI